MFPRKEGQYRCRLPDFVAVVEMIGCWIVEIHCSLDEAQTEDARVEVEVTIGAPRNARDVMNAGHDALLSRKSGDLCCRTAADIWSVGVQTQRAAGTSRKPLPTNHSFTLHGTSCAADMDAA